MKAIIFICFCLTLVAANAQQTPFSVRRLYAAAGICKDSLTALKYMLSNINMQSNPVLMCYKGAAEIISAKYSYNMFKKYHVFNRGRQLIEAAISKDTFNLEMRFLRFTIQTKLPVFLGYNNNINSDKTLILSGFTGVNDVTLKQLVINFFKNSGCCTLTDIKTLQHD